MKKCFRTGAKLLAALASAFLMCNVIACDDGGGSDDPVLKKVIAGGSATATNGEKFSAEGLVYAYYDDANFGVFSAPGADAEDVTEKATFAFGSVSFKVGDKVELPAGNYDLTVTFSGMAADGTVALTVGTASGKYHLTKFNAADTEWADSDMIIKGSASSGGAEGYLVLNHKIDFANENITIEADVKFSSLSGHVGLGFISVDGSDRKGYSLLTGQNIKNVTCTLGGGGNGLTPAVTWAVDTTYHFKAEFTSANYSEDASTNSIVYTVYDANGTVLGTNTTPVWHSASDVVYVALGGTTAKNASYSNISIKVGSTEYEFDGLDEQTVLSSLSVSASSARILLNDSETITYTSKAAGADAGVTLDYDSTYLTVTDDKNGTLTIKGIAATTSTTLKVLNKAATYIYAEINVVVEDFVSSDSYGSLTTVYPANGEAAAYEDGELRITFDASPTVAESASISIYDSDGNWVDTVKASDETLSVQSGNTINVKDQLIRVSGNAVYFTPHYGVLEAGKTYYVAIPKDAITGTLNGKTFVGLTNDKSNASWKFTVRSAPSISSTITVDGSENSTADFRTVHGALLAIGSQTGDYTINIAAGTYREPVHFNGGANITLAGQGTNARGTDTVIQWTNLNKWNGSMDTRAVVYFGASAGNLIVKNLTIKNTCDRSVVGTADTQAEALYDKSSNKLVVYNSTLLSHQDTVCTRGPSWFYDCYIEGDTDFIWGYSDVALFEKCDLKCLADVTKLSKSAADILFVSRCGTLSKAKMGKGYVLLNSTVTVEDGITAYLGRNAGSGDFYDQIAVVNTSFAVEGTGVVSSDLWSGATVYSYLDGKEDKIGLKYYNLTGNISTASAIAHVAAISASDYAKEFNGRRTVLNRVYVKEDDSYATGSAWDETYLTALEADANAVEDESKDNVYGEEATYSWLVETTADGTYTDGNLSVTISGSNANDHGVEVKATGKTTVTISLPVGSYILDAGTCKYGNDDNPYVLTCDNTDFAQEFIGTHTYATEDCYKGSRTVLYGDVYMISSESDMVITLNSNGVKEYMPFIKAIKTPKYFVETTADGTYTSGDMKVTISGSNANDHGVEVKSTGKTTVTISLPAGSYILDAGTCKYGNADNPYVLTCSNSDFAQEFIGTHTYATEDCYKGSRTALYGDIYMISSAEAMEITLNSNGVKEYLPFIGVDK